MSISQTLWNSSSYDDHKLINFNVPKYLISNFDNLVRFKRVSRTSMLVRLMEDYIRSEHQKMKEDDTLNLMIKDVEYRNREDIKREIRKDVREVRDEYEPPMIPITSDYDNGDWENDLMRLWCWVNSQLQNQNQNWSNPYNPSPILKLRWLMYSVEVTNKNSINILIRWLWTVTSP